jgi:hypothetical protein
MNELNFSHGSEVFEIIDNDCNDSVASSSPIYWTNDMAEDYDQKEDNPEHASGNELNGDYRVDQQTLLEDRSRLVEQLDLSSGKVVHRYPSISCAARIMKTSMENISMYCRGNQSLEQLYGWRYVTGDLAPGE